MCWIVDVLNQALASLVGRVGLSGEDELHGAVPVVQQPLQSLQVTEYEGSSFVRGEAARKADDERVGVEKRAGAQHLLRIHHALNTPLPRPLADQRRQFAF
jgi:hypothetical protein